MINKSKIRQISFVQFVKVEEFEHLYGTTSDIYSWFHTGDIRTRLMNAHDADPHKWPWQILIKRSGRFICGGALISADWVLTAAHCFYYNRNPALYTVEIGKHNRGTTYITLGSKV